MVGWCSMGTFNDPWYSGRYGSCTSCLRTSSPRKICWHCWICWMLSSCTEVVLDDLSGFISSWSGHLSSANGTLLPKGSLSHCMKSSWNRESHSDRKNQLWKNMDSLQLRNIGLLNGGEFLSRDWAGSWQWRTLKIIELHHHFHHFPSRSQFCEPCFSQGAEEGGLPCCRSRKGVRVAIRRQYSVGNERLLKHITRWMEDLCTECVSKALEILKVGQNKCL